MQYISDIYTKKFFIEEFQNFRNEIGNKVRELGLTQEKLDALLNDYEDLN